MRKIKKKTCIFASLMVGFATFATYKAYKAYYVDLSEQDLIVLENVLAITDAPPKPNLVYVLFEKKWCWVPTSHEIHNTKGEVIGAYSMFTHIVEKNSIDVDIYHLNAIRKATGQHVHQDLTIHSARGLRPQHPISLKMK